MVSATHEKVFDVQFLFRIGATFHIGIQYQNCLQSCSLINSRKIFRLHVALFMHLFTYFAFQFCRKNYKLRKMQSVGNDETIITKQEGIRIPKQKCYQSGSSTYP